MGATIGNARISEFGTVNGKKGDQTGKEVMTQSFASGGKWEYCIRPKSEAVAKKIATAMKQACANNNIGYSQIDRISLSKEAAKHNYKISNVGKCNCDCSSLVAVCVNAAGIHVSPYMYTGNELALLKATGKFTIITAAAQCKKGKGLKAGDILLRKGHTAIVTQGDAAVKPAKKAAAKKSIDTIAQEVIDGKWGSGDARKAKLKAAGYDYNTVQAKVNALLAKKATPAKSSAKKSTTKKKAKKSNATIAKEVIAGKWGSGETRKKKLKAAGYNYAAIQKEVNKLMK